MSEVWLFLAIGSLFLCIVMVGVFIDQTRTDKQRAVRLLESQVTGPSGQSTVKVDLREQEMSENFGTRVLVPIVARAGKFARRITPLDTRDRISKKLLIAGSPAGWDAERVLAFKIIGAVAGFIGSLVLLQIVHLSVFLQIVVVGLLTFAGFVVPDSILNNRVDDRKREILRTLSDTLDLLTISVEAGLSLNAAIAQVVRNVPGVLSSEFARMLQEIQLGVPRAEAFRHLGRAHRRRGAQRLRAGDDPGGHLRCVDRERAADPGRAGPDQAAPGDRGARPADAGEDRLPAGALHPPGAVHRDRRARRDPDLPDVLGPVSPAEHRSRRGDATGGRPQAHC